MSVLGDLLGFVPIRLEIISFSSHLIRISPPPRSANGPSVFRVCFVYKIMSPFLFRTLVYFLVTWGTTGALWISPGRTLRPNVRRFGSPINEDDEEPRGTSRRRGYQFGDLTRRLIGDRVNQITGKEEPYEFGDLSRWVDGTIKKRINTLTDKEEYELGDLSKWAWGKVGNATQDYTGKESYEVGDLSKEVIRRVRSGEYAMSDVWLACRILLSAGLGFLTPVATILPLRTLLDLVNIGLAQEVSGRLLEEMAGFLDRRFKEALTGKADYQVGDLTKDRLESAITKWTGKDSYEFGDITRHVRKLAVEASAEAPSTTRTTGSNKKPSQIHIEEKSMRELDKWDAKFLSQEA